MKQTVIRSQSNPRLKHFKKLLQDRAYRREALQFVVEGLRALDGIARVQTLFISDEKPVPAIPADEVCVISKETFRQISDTEHSQGIAAILPLRILHAEALHSDARYMLIDRLQDPGNMGSVLRSAAAFNIRGIILTPETVDPFSPKVVRAAAGAHSKLEFIEIERVSQISEYTVIAADAKGEDITFFRWPKNFVLAIGNEGSGISNEVRDAAKQVVAIPMPGGAESLNAAVAAGIILYCAFSGKIS